MVIRTGKILIKLEAGLSNQLPLLCLNMSANGEFNNWSLKVKIFEKKIKKLTKKIIIFSIVKFSQA